MPSAAVPPPARHVAVYAVLGLCAICSLASSVWLRQPQLELEQLVQLPGGEGGREDRVYGRIESMNEKLRLENEKLHKLLQGDENADIHMETKLQRDDARKSRRLSKEMEREETLRAELDTVLGKRGQGREMDVVQSGSEAAMSHRVKEQAEVESLLDAAKAEADSKLGLSDHADVEKAFAVDVDDALGPRESSEVDDVSERPGGAEGKRARMSARQRRRLRRHERHNYNDEMRQAEVNLRHGHPHRSRRALRRALKDHEEEEKLRGFVGEAVYKKPEAWKLLRSTIRDDLADHAEAERVEDNMRAVVQLHRDVESAQHQYEDSKQVAAKVPEAGRMAFMLNVPTRDGGFKAEKVITKKMEGELNKEERAWERADALEAAKAAAARELHLAEEGDSGGKAGTKLHIIGGKPLKTVHFIPKHPFGELPSSSTKAPQQQLAMQQAPPQQQPLAAPRAARAPPPSQDTRAGGSEFEYKWRYPPQTQAAAPAQAPQEEYETGVPHAVLKKLKVYHAPSAALNGQDLAIKSKWHAVKAVNKSRRYVGVAKDLPKEPREVSNDIVERLLKLAHAGKLTAPEDVTKTEHPISDAIESHEKDNRRVDKQEASYLSSKPPKSARRHATLKGPTVFPTAAAVAKLEAPGMRQKIVARVEARALAREEARDAREQQAKVELRKLAAKEALTSRTRDVDRDARRDAAKVVALEENKAAEAAAKEDARAKQLAEQQAEAARAQRRAASKAAAEARRKAMAPQGVWGLISAPIHALFGDSEVQKNTPYLPA